MVVHGHFLVNGKKVDRRSFEVKPGMVISLKPKAQLLAPIKQSVENTGRDIPGYLELDPISFSGKLVSEPHMDQVPFPIPVNVPLVCEHLAHTS